MVTQMKQSFLVLFLIFSAFTYAEETFEPFDDPVHAEIIYEKQSIQPGQPFWAGIRLSMDPGWHAYWKNPGDAGMTPDIQWSLPEGYQTSDLHWPTPTKFTAMDAVGYGYEDEVILLVKITPSQTSSSAAEIGADIRWVVCDHASCLPGGAEIQVTLPVSHSTPAIHTTHAQHFSKARKQLPKPISSVNAHRKNGLITLQLDHPESINHAIFYPEHSERVDASVEPVIVDSNQIILKDANSANSEPLKGVLVINGKDALEITASLSANHGSDIAFNLDSESSQISDPHAYKGGFFLAIALAFLGGLILNCMPCVLPVISFKVLSFVKMAGQSRTLIFKHGLAFSFGVLISFWTLAGVLLMLQSWGQTVGWGFQLQEPLFVGILAAIIFVFGLSLFGVFELGTGFASMAGQASTKNETGLIGSFFSGILATAVATPCTGPFLGTAIGFAVTLPTLQAMMIFTSLGLGMASPYLMLGAFPSLLKYMPKPGNWMIAFKEIMGFIMVATVLWLIWVFGAQTDTLAMFFLLAGFFILSFGCWVFGKWGTPIKKKSTRLVSFAVTLACFILGGYTIVKASSITPPQQEISDVAMADLSDPSAKWIKFSTEKLAHYQELGIPVFIDFTAKWCLICQANHVVLEADSVKEKFKEKGVVKMLADWTRNDPEITNYLAKFGRNGVPLYVLFDGSPNAQPVILPQVLSPDLVIGHLDELNQ